MKSQENIIRISLTCSKTESNGFVFIDNKINCFKLQGSGETYFIQILTTSTASQYDVDTREIVALFYLEEQD